LARFGKLTLLSPGEVWLERLRVNPAHWRKRAAKALGRHQLAVARALKPRSLRFATAEVNVESLHIARNQGFREISRFVYPDGPVRDEAAPTQAESVRDPGAAWEFIRFSSAYRVARGLMAWGCRFPQLTPDRLPALVAQGAVLSHGDPVSGLHILVPDPYAPQAFASAAFVDGSDEALHVLLRLAHA
jgi:hypothetical protein